ncbi:MAG: bifunctional phosphoribosyl-AMP cyclohydrolase/phosphoribosyl-ATP diphosphatase HisIE [Pseudomonadota bacterium]
MNSQAQHWIDSINWDKVGGLIPGIIQHHRTGQVLMLGYLSPESIEKTLATGLVTFFSRSRQQLWTKGETSGHTLELVDLALDCDVDTLLIQANPNGPTCHKGITSCFGEHPPPQVGFLATLDALIRARTSAAPDTSYTARLLNEGVDRCAQKVGEEGVEVALAAVSQSTEALLEESADLIYHLLVLLRAKNLELDDAIAVLQQRHSD